MAYVILSDAEIRLRNEQAAKAAAKQARMKERGKRRVSAAFSLLAAAIALIVSYYNNPHINQDFRLGAAMATGLFVWIAWKIGYMPWNKGNFFDNLGSGKVTPFSYLIPVILSAASAAGLMYYLQQSYPPPYTQIHMINVYLSVAAAALGGALSIIVPRLPSILMSLGAFGLATMVYVPAYGLSHGMTLEKVRQTIMIDANKFQGDVYPPNHTEVLVFHPSGPPAANSK